MAKRHPAEPPLRDLASWREDEELLALTRACIERQVELAADARAAYRPNEHAAEAVSPEALEGVLRAGEDVHGIASDRSISNVIVFNAAHIGDAVLSPEVRRLRDRVDVHVRRQRGWERALSSGHFWYPPGGYMSWHTNAGAPGLRLYLSYAREPGRSFFRYRDPQTGRS